MDKYDAIIIGAGAAGLMCASTAAKRGRKVLLIEHNKDIGRKILISGGGRCNFTNINTTHENFQSSNTHFVKSALAQYTPQDFVELIQKHKIKYFEKKLGQLFCEVSAKEIIALFRKECQQSGVDILTDTKVQILQKDNHYKLETNRGNFEADNVVIATGGLSLPTIGATEFGHQIARQFKLKTTATTPALVPFTLYPDDLQNFNDMAGLSLPTLITIDKRKITEDILFTHKGLSGPVILQASLYWNNQSPIKIDFSPNKNIEDYLIKNKKNNTIENLLNDFFPNRFINKWIEHYADFPAQSKASELSDKSLRKFAQKIHQFDITPSGTEGFRKAEVTKGGVSTAELSSKTMEAKKVPGLYFIGEVVDVTGQLGGYNFQWAWASGYVAGNAI